MRTTSLIGSNHDGTSDEMTYAIGVPGIQAKASVAEFSEPLLYSTVKLYPISLFSHLC